MSPSFIPKFCLILASTLVVSSCSQSSGSIAETDKPPQDEAKLAGLTPQDFRYPVSDATNFLKGMDVAATVEGSTAADAAGNAAKLRVDQLLDKASEQPPTALVDPVSTKSEILGRNTWMLWCGGNEAFWDWLAGHSYGLTDFVKLIDSRERATRFARGGMINEPGMKTAAQPDKYGLWIDVPADNTPGPVPLASIYGRSSGVVGLRLFPNPKFDDKAAKAWNAGRYYNDKSYFNNPKLIRPYRVGMACAFCHASFTPLNPPQNAAEPQWSNISGNIGAQYLRVRAVVGNLLTKDNFVYQLLDSQLPGTVDTSLVASDSINNPNAMNGVFCLKQRVVRAFINPPETLVGGGLSQPTLWGNPKAPVAEGDPDTFVWQVNPATKAIDYLGREADKIPYGLVQALKAAKYPAGSNATLYDLVAASNDTATRNVPHVLLDGADSIGAWGALARVYLNIGTFYEQWIRLQTPLIGGTPQKPFEIRVLEENSVYWQATEERVAPLRDYFLKVSGKMPLLAARGGEGRAGAGAAKSAADRIRQVDVSQLALGRKVFADNCIVCHSSIQPPEREADLAKWAKQGEFWDHDPGRWLQDPAYLKWAEEAVETPEFWRDNYLSTDLRIPVTTIKTNSKRAVATNGLGGHVWDNFTSDSYKKLPPPGPIPFFNPYAGENGAYETYTPRNITPPGSPEGGGGVGYYRVPSLVSIWATAPFLHNNSLGLFNNDPSLDGRLVAFDDAMRKMLWPELRTMISAADLTPYNGATGDRLKRDHGLIWRTSVPSYLKVPAQQVPGLLENLPIAHLKALLAWATMFEAAPWLPGAVFFAAAYLVLLLTGRSRQNEDPNAALRRKKLSHVLGLSALAVSIVLTGLIYFANGDLGDLRIGPIPAGTPVDLLANINLETNPADLKKALNATVAALAEIESKHLSQEEADKVMRTKVAPALMKISRSPDFVMDKGHYFPWFRDMSDADKSALIELLKTF